MKILITRPYCDKATHYLFYWAEILIDEAKRRGLKFFDLKKKKAVRKNVESYLCKQNPDLVLFNGHGNDSSILGQDKKPLVSANDNEYLLEEKTIYTRACNAGKFLGPKAIEGGAIGFIGYKEPFRFWRDENSLSRPLQDELAAPFLECSNQIGLSLIKNHSAREAHDKSIKLYKKKIVEMLTSESSNIFILPELRANMNSQVCYDQSSTD